MVAKGSPEWLPAGWTVQYKVQKTGRKIRVYKNLETGRTFFSKEEVIQQNKSTLLEKPMPSTEHTTVLSRNNPVKDVVENEERPQWLPDGWHVEVKTRMSGSRAGTMYKCYSNPLNGSKFYSKPEVFRYLKTIKHKFRPLEKRKSSTNTSSPNKAVVEQVNKEDLPPGWIKEIKIRKNGNGIRKDPYYTDPISGYVFRSRKDALCYLETGKISRSAFKSKKRGSNDEELISENTSPPSTAKRQKLEPNGTRQQTYAGKGSSKKSGLVMPEAENKEARNACAEMEAPSVSTVETVPKTPSRKKVIQQSAENKRKNDPRSQFPEVDHSRITRSKGLSPDILAVSSQEKNLLEKIPSRKKVVQQSAENKEKNDPRSQFPKADHTRSTRSKGLSLDILAVSSQEKNLPEEEGGRSDLSNTKNKSGKSKQKKDLIVPHRSSKRLSGLEPEVLANVDSSEYGIKVSGRNHPKKRAIPDANLSLDTSADGACQQIQAGAKTGNEDQLSPHIRNPLYVNLSEERENTANPLKDQDVSKEQQQSAKAEKINETENGPQIPIPFADFLSDPCLEFAIKTLTGSLPVENAAEDGPVSIPPANKPLDKICENGTENSITKRTEVNSKKLSTKKTELTLLRRRSKRFGTFQPEPPAANLMSTEQSCLNSTIMSIVADIAATHGETLYKSDDSQLLQTEPVYKDAHCLGTDLIGSTQGEPSKRSGRFHENQAVLEEQQVELQRKNQAVLAEQHVELQKKNQAVLEEQQVELQKNKDNEIAKPQLPFSFPDSWSDPCLDFAFKTLTGEIPLEDSLGNHGYFHEQIEPSQTQKDCTTTFVLPDFGSTSFFQSDISSHFDVSETVLDSSLIPSRNVSSPSFSTSQQLRMESDKDFQGKVQSWSKNI